MNWPFGRPLESPSWPPSAGGGFDPDGASAWAKGRARRLAGRRSPWRTVGIPALCFIATLFTTLLAGAMQRGVYPDAAVASPDLLLRGLPFAGTLLLILGAHELGHYFASRSWGIEASLPYFIPAPTLFGTFGAVIRIRGRIANRKALMDVAVAGPLAGLAVAIPATLAGLALSRVVPLEGGGAEGGIGLGTSWLFDAASWLVLGTVGKGVNIVLHPVAFAGWCGFLITSLNLIPAGQLDGGHIVYTLFGRWHRRISFASGFVLLAMSYWWPGWLIWAAVALVLGRRHPPLLDEWEPLDRGRRAAGYLCLALMILTFTRIPLLLS
ncbi:MAG: site-2 protease family protein [bacterium]